MSRQLCFYPTACTGLDMRFKPIPQTSGSQTYAHRKGSKRCFPNGRKLWNFLDPQFLKNYPCEPTSENQELSLPGLSLSLHSPLLQASCGDSMPSLLPKVICCNIALLNTRIHHHTPKKGDMGVGQTTLKSRAFHPRIASTPWMFIPF